MSVIKHCSLNPNDKHSFFVNVHLNREPNTKHYFLELIKFLNYNTGLSPFLEDLRLDFSPFEDFYGLSNLCL